MLQKIKVECCVLYAACIKYEKGRKQKADLVTLIASKEGSR